jgi:ferredoxin
MKVHVDEDLCIGCGNCVDICPEIFEMEDDKAVAKMEDVPEDMEESCREASESCPVDAIPLEED